MNLIKGDLWQEVATADLILFTANSSLDRYGRLVMGAGSAMEAQQRWPDLPARIGADLREWGMVNDEYLLWLPDSMNDPKPYVGAFQTKRQWFRKSNLHLIARSCDALAEELTGSRSWAKRVAMPFPGIGFGGLQREKVLPLLSCLPDSVFVYER